jgi:hypothetical protein
VGSTGVSIGCGAGQTAQGSFAVAVGYDAGTLNQGNFSIAIGYEAGPSGQSNNSIILNASGTALNGPTSGFYVSPVRNATGPYYMYYDPSSSEVVYSNCQVQGKLGIQALTGAAGITFTIGNTPQITNVYSIVDMSATLVPNNSSVCPTNKYITFSTTVSTAKFQIYPSSMIYPGFASVSRLDTSANGANLVLLYNPGTGTDWWIQSNNGFTLF